MQQLSRPFFAIKDIDTTGRRVQFYGSAFGNMDSDGDIMMPGCYAKTIQENGPQSRQPRIKHLKQHNTRDILGAFAELAEDTKGLLCLSDIAKTRDGDDALALYELNLYEHSVGFQTLKSEWDQTDPANPLRRITEVRLWEVSSVTWGANSDTPFVGFKSHDPAACLAGVESLNDRLDKLFKALRTGNLQDSTYLMLETEADQLKTAYKGLISLSGEPLKPAAPEAVTPEAGEPSGEKALNEFFNLLTA